jgi:hypothetical protein
MLSDLPDFGDLAAPGLGIERDILAEAEQGW